MAPLPAQARANSNQPSSTDARGDAERRVEFIAVTQSDELLEQIGQALDGESAIRHAETIAAAAELIQASQPCVVMLDAREHAVAFPARDPIGERTEQPVRATIGRPALVLAVVSGDSL